MWQPEIENEDRYLEMYSLSRTIYCNLIMKYNELEKKWRVSKVKTKKKKGIYQTQKLNYGKFETENLSPYIFVLGGVPSVKDTFVGNVHGDTSSNPGRDCLYFT